MTSLQLRLILTLVLVGGGLLALKTSFDLDRAQAPVEARAREMARAALVEAGPRLERAYVHGREAALPEALAPLLQIPGAKSAAVTDAQGHLLASSPARGPDVEAEALAPAFQLAGRAGEEGPRLDMDGSVLVGALPIRLEHGPPDADLTGPPPPALGAGFALVRFDFSSAMAAARSRALRANGIIALGLLALVLAVGLVTWLSLGRSVARLTRTIDRFDLGERGARSGMRHGALQELSRAFDAMAQRMQSHEEELIEAKLRHEMVLRCLPVGVMVVRRDDGRPVFVNARWKELFGIPMDATRDILSLLSTMRCERPDGSPYPLEQLPIPTALRSGQPAQVDDLRVRRDDAVVALRAGAVPVSLWRSDTFDAVIAVVEQPGGPMVPSEAPEPDASLPARIRDEERREPPADDGPIEVTAFPIGGTALDAPSVAEEILEPERELETVLVIEGEESLRELAERALSQAGYRVLVTGHADEALTVVHGEGGALRAVVLDLWVPGTSGDALLDELLALDPSARIIAASGYRADMPQLAASGKVAAFLPKPYGEERLLNAVREAVERSSMELAGR